MTIKDKYYDYVLMGKKVSLPEEIIFAIVHDFSDRRGLRQEWEQLGEDKQCEIMDTWIGKVKSNKTSSPEEIILIFMEDFTNRDGIGSEWANIDGDIQSEITDVWVEIVKTKII
jgi:hypothetical protein